jgi:hypothetical protein
MDEVLAWVHSRTEEAVAEERRKARLWATLTPKFPGEGAVMHWSDWAVRERLQRRRVEHGLRPLPEPVNILEQRRQETLSAMPISFSRAGRRALALLWPYLEDGAVYSSGLRKPDGEREQIPPSTWSDLSPQMPTTTAKPTEVVLGNRAGATVWHWPLFRDDDVKKLFPAPVEGGPEVVTEPLPSKKKTKAEHIADVLQEAFPERPVMSVPELHALYAHLGSRRTFEHALNDVLWRRDPVKWPKTSAKTSADDLRTSAEPPQKPSKP